MIRAAHVVEIARREIWIFDVGFASMQHGRKILMNMATLMLEIFRKSSTCIHDRYDNSE